MILQHFFLRKDSIVAQYEVWKRGLEESMKKFKAGDSSLQVLQDHLHSLNKSMETLQGELDKIKEEDFKPDPTEQEPEEEASAVDKGQ